MLIYFFIPIILYILIKINIMTIFICISLYIREMFSFKQISSHFSITDVCFFRWRTGGFTAHANDNVITRLLTLTNSAPLALSHPTLPPLAKLLVWVLRAFSRLVFGPLGNACANDSRGVALGLMSVSQLQHNVYSLILLYFLC